MSKIIIPYEIINKILLFREKHPVAKLLCCRECNDDYEWCFPEIYDIEGNYIKKGYFYILCSDCLCDMAKD